jgi:hypothetical protein
VLKSLDVYPTVAMSWGKRRSVLRTIGLSRFAHAPGCNTEYSFECFAECGVGIVLNAILSIAAAATGVMKLRARERSEDSDRSGSNREPPRIRSPLEPRLERAVSTDLRRLTELTV